MKMIRPYVAGSSPQTENAEQLMAFAIEVIRRIPNAFGNPFPQINQPDNSVMLEFRATSDESSLQYLGEQDWEIICGLNELVVIGPSSEEGERYCFTFGLIMAIAGYEVESGQTQPPGMAEA